MGFGQARITQADIDLVREQPQRIRGHLAHHRVSSAADLVHARFDQCRTIAAERDAGLCGPSPMRIDGGGDALPDEITTIAHRAQLGFAFVPAKTPRALGEAPTQATRRERTAAVGIDAGVVEKPQCDGIHADAVSELVHRALDREVSERLVRRAHHRRRVAVRVDDLVIRRDAARRTPQRATRIRRVFDVVVEDRRWRDAFVADRSQSAGFVGGERDRLDRRRLVTHHRVHLRAGQLNAHRTTDFAGGNRCHHRVRPHVCLASKPAAQEVRYHLDAVARQPEHDRYEVTRAENVLRSVVQREPAARVPGSERHVRLHLVVMPITRGIDALDFHGAVGQALGRVPDR